MARDRYTWGRRWLGTLARLTTLALVAAGSVVGSAVPAQAATVTLTPIATGFNNPIAVDFHQPTSKLLLSVNYPFGQPRNFELVAQDGTRAQFTNISGLTDEVYIATVRSSSCQGGFTVGEAFVGNGRPGQIVRISPDGTSVQNPWVTLPGELGLLRGGLFQDRFCSFGGDLIVTATGGNVWRVTSAGTPTRIANVGGFSENEGPTTVPVDSVKYGPWSGTILVADERSGCVFSVTAAGVTTCWRFAGAPQPESIRIIPANENFFGVDFASRTLWGAPPDQFTGMVGDVLLASEFPGNLVHIRWNGSAFASEVVASVAQFEGTTFAPVGVANLPPPSKKGTTLKYTGDTTQDFHDPARVAARLTESATGNPVAGKTITFVLAGSETCQGTTGPDGQASCFVTPNERAGNYTVTATFAGDKDFSGSTTSAAFRVTREEDTLTYAGDTVIANGGTAHLSGRLLEDGSPTTPIAGRTVSFTLGSGIGAQSCSGITASSGTARCDITPVNQPLGPNTVTARFAGDDFYLPSSDAKPVLIFAFLGSGAGGAFVIGDQTAAIGASVTFWGAQWWKENSLSAGAAPPSFKGFARNTSTPPQCGQNWSTQPGNSSHPPASVPPFMALLVSSSITQSGSTLTGNTVRIVVVMTDPGYEGNPGHAGTGTVVATVCG